MGMWICFTIGGICGMIVVTLFPIVKVPPVLLRCCECKNFAALYCKPCSTELSKR
jgi:hypothetical protein